ncbi:uncharacterized protein LOC135375658 [Ornithodoros turicata]|uniref:uncharacterized protein LOC135375658 n=1 Tax=Ornithodoros turicata TaxID=34597 RepID=UPI003138EB0B
MHHSPPGRYDLRSGRKGLVLQRSRSQETLASDTSVPSEPKGSAEDKEVHAVPPSQDITLRLASNDVIPAQTAVVLWLRFDGRRRKQLFVHLPGLAVPVILGRDFIIRQKFVLDLPNGGYVYHGTSRFFPFAVPQDSSSAKQAAATSVETSPLPTVLGSFHGAEEERRQLEQVLRQFDGVFTEKPGKSSVLQHGIDTGNARPRRCNPRP